MVCAIAGCIKYPLASGNSQDQVSQTERQLEAVSLGKASILKIKNKQSASKHLKLKQQQQKKPLPTKMHALFCVDENIEKDEKIAFHNPTTQI